MPTLSPRPRRYSHAAYAGAETIRGYLWRDWKLAPIPPHIEVPTEGEMKIYHRGLAALAELDGVGYDLRWVVPKDDPHAAPSFACCVWNGYYHDDDYILIDAAEIASFTKTVRRIDAERMKGRRSRRRRRRARGPLVYAVFAKTAHPGR